MHNFLTNGVSMSHFVGFKIKTSELENITMNMIGNPKPYRVPPRQVSRRYMLSMKNYALDIECVECVL